MVQSIGIEDIAHSPAWLPLEGTSGGSVLLIRLDEDGYRAASFLDRRAVRFAREQGTCNVSLLAAAASRLQQRAHYLFHIGHVGSTLLSRLVGQHQALFSVREPVLLRTLALEGRTPGLPTLDPLLAILARSWRPEQRAVIKTTSVVNEIAGDVLKRSPGAAAIFMYATARTYLQTILGGANSRIESRTLAARRLERLRRLAAGGMWDPGLQPRSEGETIAMSWLCEMASLHQAAAATQCPVLWLDFDHFLARPVAALEAVFRALGRPITTVEAERLAASAIMCRYSKAPEHAYDAALRVEILASAATEHRDEIERGQAWLERVAGRLPLARAALEVRQPEWAG